METLTTDGLPWHCDEAANAGQAMPIAQPPKSAPCVSAAPRSAPFPASARRANADRTKGFLPRMDRFVIALTIITAMSAIAGSQAGMPSHSYELIPSSIAAPAR